MYSNMTDESDDGLALTIPVEELRQLMEIRKEDLANAIKTKYTDVIGLCQKLRTSPTHGKLWIASQILTGRRRILSAATRN